MHGVPQRNVTNINAQEALQQLPAAIRKTELDLWACTQRLDTARMRLKMREADISLKVAGMLGEDGKKKYTNQDQRDAAVSGHLANDAEHAAMSKALLEDQAIKARIEAALQYQKDVQRNARVLILARTPSDLVFDTNEDLGVIQ